MLPPTDCVPCDEGSRMLLREVSARKRSDTEAASADTCGLRQAPVTTLSDTINRTGHSEGSTTHQL